MSTDILKSEVIPAVKVDKQETSKVVAPESKKEGLSLFDSILTKTKSKIISSTTEVANKKETISKEKISKDNLLDTTISANTKKIVDNEPKTPKLSLLDRMAKDIKIESSLKKVKVDNKIEVKENKVKPKEDKTNITPSKVKIEDKDTKINNTPLVKKEITIPLEDQITSKTPTQNKSVNLLDNLVKNIKEVKNKSIDKDEIVSVIKDDIVVKTKSDNIAIPDNKIVSNGDDKQISLLDSLIKQNKDIKITDDNSTKSVSGTKDDSKISEPPLQAKMFLSNQMAQKDITSSKKIVEARELLTKENKSTANIKKSADTLELNATKVEVSEEKDVLDKKTVKIVENTINIKEQFNKQTNMLNKIFLNQNKSNENIALLKEIETTNRKKTVEVKSVKENAVNVDEDIRVTVEQTVAQSITTKIIESKQKMNSFMSDVAKTIYLNYKPPITAFKIRLDPANLGSIAIMMKSDKVNNSISVNLNMSQNNTLETFNENRASLQNALNKVFNTESTFSLDFGMQGENSSSFEQFNQHQNNQSSNEKNSNDLNIKNEEEIEEEQSYM